MSDTSLDLSRTFPDASEAEWQALVSAAFLRGSTAGDTGRESEAEINKAAQQALTHTSLDGIETQALYSRNSLTEDLPLDTARRQPNHQSTSKNTVSSIPSHPGWDIRQNVRELSLQQANRSVLTELINGCSSVQLSIESGKVAQPSATRCGLESARLVINSSDDLGCLLNEVHLEMITVACEPALPDANLCQYWSEFIQQQTIDPANWHLDLNANLFSDTKPASAGEANDGVPAKEILLQKIKEHQLDFPCITHCAADSRPWHQRGASNVQELALACSAGFEYLRLLQTCGLDIRRANDQILFHLAIDNDYFSGIAKLRALRELWNYVLVHCDSAATNLTPRIHAHTSLRMLSRLDADNNQLRNTIACAAAAVGGADIISVEPHQPSDPGSSFPAVGASTEAQRIARNIQHVLQQESHLHRIQDPMGGSAFIENQTSQLVQHAWPLLQQIEAAGGLSEFIEAGELDNWLNSSLATRQKQVASRTLPIVGVSAFPAPEPAVVTAAHSDVNLKATGIIRDAEPFETLRQRVARHCSSLSMDKPDSHARDNHNHSNGTGTGTGKDNNAEIILACFGQAAMSRARADFVQQLLAAGGLKAREIILAADNGTENANQGTDRVGNLSKNLLDHIINLTSAKSEESDESGHFDASSTLVFLCSDNKSYRQSGNALASSLKAAGIGCVALAGNGREIFADSEADYDFDVYAGCDILDAIDQVISAVSLDSANPGQHTESSNQLKSGDDA